MYSSTGWEEKRNERREEALGGAWEQTVWEENGNDKRSDSGHRHRLIAEEEQITPKLLLTLFPTLTPALQRGQRASSFSEGLGRVQEDRWAFLLPEEQ